MTRLVDSSGTTVFEGEVEGLVAGLPTGWTEDAANPANVSTGGADLNVPGTGTVRVGSGSESAAVTENVIGVFDTGTGAEALMRANGYSAKPAPGAVAFAALGTLGATVALDAGGLLVRNVAPIQSAAAPPAGAPTGLPFALDTTAVTGGLYVWSGAAWVKVSALP